MEKKIAFYKKLYPVFHTFTGDLLFYIAVSSLFLTLAKGFSAAQIVSFTAVTRIISVCLTVPIKMVITRIGNTNSVRLSGVLLFLSAILLTFGPNYYWVLLGNVVHCISNTFRAANVVILENNLHMVNEKDDFVRVRAAGNTGYSVITMLIAFVASPLFNVNRYLPMIGCIICAGVGMVLSFLMVDHSPYDKIGVKTKNKIISFKFEKMVLLAVLSYGFYYSLANNAPAHIKLFVQEYLLTAFSEENTVLIIGAIVCASRISRVFANIVFPWLYKKAQVKMGMILTSLYTMSIGFSLFGSFIPYTLPKILVMGLGYIILLFLRDPYRLYIQDVIFAATDREDHQTLLVLLELANKISAAAISVLFTLVLLKQPMLFVVSIEFVFGLIQIGLAVYIYHLIKASKAQKAEVLGA